MVAAPGRPWRLGFDAVRALRNRTGLGHYARLVLEGLAEVAPDRELHLYTPRPADPRYATLPDAIGGHVHPPDSPWRAPIARQLWRTFRLGHDVRRDGIDLYHGLTQEIPRDLPRAGIRSVLSVPDLLYLTRPELFRPVDRRSYHWRYRWSAEHADLLIAISDGTRRDLVTHFEVEPARVVVLPPAVDPRFAAPVSAEALARVAARYEINGPYMIAVGTLEPRKNQRLAIEALALMPDDAPRLVLVGRDGGSAALLARLARARGVAHRVTTLTAVSDGDLPALVAGAVLANYLSTGEGFGMPIVEAMAAGVPVVATQAANLEDAGGDATVYVPADDPAALAAAWSAWLGDPIRRAERAERARAHARRFDHRLLAERLVAIYDAVHAGAPFPSTD
jgi:glycosyltransferase involved in cell wall biosynthesis